MRVFGEEEADGGEVVLGCCCVWEYRMLEVTLENPEDRMAKKPKLCISGIADVPIRYLLGEGSVKGSTRSSIPSDEYEKGYRDTYVGA